MLAAAAAIDCCAGSLLVSEPRTIAIDASNSPCGCSLPATAAAAAAGLGPGLKGWTAPAARQYSCTPAAAKQVDGPSARTVHRMIFRSNVLDS